MDSQERSKIYKALYREIIEERKEFRLAGKVILKQHGISYSGFKNVAYQLIHYPFKSWRESDLLFNSFCEQVGEGIIEGTFESLNHYLTEIYKDREMETHGCCLKSKPDNRL